MATAKKKVSRKAPAKKKAATKKAPARKKSAAKKKAPAKKAPAKKATGHMALLASWSAFVKKRVTELSLEQLKEMLDHEKKHGKRWSFINRLHGAYNSKRVKAERDELRQKFR